jgi:hypothetical protein
MVGEPSHVKQLSLNHVCKIGLNVTSFKAVELANQTSRVTEKRLIFRQTDSLVLRPPFCLMESLMECTSFSTVWGCPH